MQLREFFFTGFLLHSAHGTTSDKGINWNCRANGTVVLTITGHVSLQKFEEIK